MLTRLGWYGELLALLAGGIMPFAFAPYSIYPLAVIALALLFAAWLAVSPRRACLRGLLFGIGMFGVGIHWIYISIHGFGGVPMPLALALSALLVIYLSLFPATMGYLLNRFVPGLSARSVVLKLVLIFPAAWAFTEWFRGWLFTGFPWLSLGYSQIDSPLAGFAPLLGVYGVSWSLALCAGLLVLLVLRKGVFSRLASITAIVFIIVCGGALLRVSWTHNAAEPVRVSLVQGNIPQALKWEKDVYWPTLERYLDLSRELWDSELVVWPETAISEFYHRAEGFIDELWREARANQSDLLTGVLYLDRGTRQYYNALLGLADDKSFYFKSHLVPFTEYLPLKTVLGDIVDFMQVPMSNFSAGDIDQPPMMLAGQPIGLSICYEDVFGEELARTVSDVTLLANVSNDGWFGGSSAAFQHQQIARMRALELGRPMLRATNTGVSSIIDHKGQLLATSKLNIVDTVTADVQPQSGLTPYGWTKNYSIVLITIALIIVAALFKQRTVRD